MPAKIEQVCQSREGNDIFTSVWESMSACHSLSIKWSCYGGGQFNGGRMVLQRWSVKSRENDHVNLVSLMERE